MANEENLIPFNERTESEQRQIAQKGGIASGAARRRKRSMKEAADYYLSLPETDRRRVNALLRDEVDNEDIDNQMSVVMGITEAAKRGDARAAGVLLKMLGEDNPPDDTAADTGSKCYHDNVFTAFCCPLPHLSESCNVGIISCFDLKTCQISEFFLYIHDSPA